MTTSRVDQLLDALRQDIHASPSPVREIEVGTELSIALGRRRDAVACGGCSTPLTYEGIPARTVVGLKVPYRLVVDAPAVGAA